MSRPKGNYAEGSVYKHILRISLPIMVAEMVHVLYNIVDRIYIGRIDEVGTIALTGIGLTVPLLTLVTAFASFVSTGGSSLCSIERGKGDDEEAKALQENAFTLLLVIAAVLTAVLFAFAKPILLKIGADENTVVYALAYFRIYIMGSVFVLISLGMTPYINMQGFSEIGMTGVLMGAITNIILDPIFIFVFGLGIRGAAIATVISQFLNAIWVLRFFLSDKASLKIGRLHMETKRLKRILVQGSSGFAFKATNSLTQGVVNASLLAYGGSLSTYYIGAMTAINSLREVASQPILGFGNGSQPVLGYNYGANKPERVSQGIKFLFLSSLSYNIIAWLVIMFFTPSLMGLFTDDPRLIEIGTECARAYFAAYCFMALQQTGQTVFVGLAKPKRAVFFSLLRKAVLVVPFTLILPRIGFGVMGVFRAEMFSQLIGASICFTTMTLTVWLKLGREQK